MPIREIEPLARETTQYERVAARHNLCFHIDQFGYLTEHAGWKSEHREATYAELEMWRTLCPELPCGGWPPPEVPTLDATEKELADCLILDGPCTLNTHDVTVLRHIPNFVPCLDRTSLLKGLIGNLGRTSIYVSRAIPKGYFYEGTIVRWQPPLERTVEPDLDAATELTISVQLRPFMERNY